MSDKFDAIVVGAGIIGACTGYELAKKGYKVLNIDKLPEAGTVPLQDRARSSGCTIPRRTAWPWRARGITTGWIGPSTSKP